MGPRNGPYESHSLLFGAQRSIKMQSLQSIIESFQSTIDYTSIKCALTTEFMKTTCSVPGTGKRTKTHDIPLHFKLMNESKEQLGML